MTILAKHTKEIREILEGKQHGVLDAERITKLLKVFRQFEPDDRINLVQLTGLQIDRDKLIASLNNEVEECFKLDDMESGLSAFAGQYLFSEIVYPEELKNAG